MPPSDTEPAPTAGASRAFHCSCRHGALDAAWIHASGALDFATSPELEQALADAHAHARLVVLDLRELTFMGCAGMHAIVDDSRRARQAGGRLVLVRGDPGIYRLFAVTGSLDDVEIADLDRPPPLAQTQRSLVSQSVLATG